MNIKNKDVYSFVECIAFLLVDNNTGKILVEKRRSSEKLDPGAIAIPGGHIEGKETLITALKREMYEELGVLPLQIDYICSLIHLTTETERIHYFAIGKWRGIIKTYEADALLWIKFNEKKKLDQIVDRVALSEYLRIYFHPHQEEKVSRLKQ